MDSKSIIGVLICWIASVECLINNVSRLHQDFPSIKDGDPCVKGRMYRMACNTCRCADNNALYCTKMACLEEVDMLRIKILQQHNLRNQRSVDGQKKIKKDSLGTQKSGDEKKISKKDNVTNLGSENKTSKLTKDSSRTQKSGDEQKKFKKESLRNLGSENRASKVKKDSLRTQRSKDQQMMKKDRLKNFGSENKAEKIKKEIFKSQRAGNEKKLKKDDLRSLTVKEVEKMNKEKEKYLPTVPNGPCTPGKIYRQECRKCYCKEEGKSACSAPTKTGCNDYPKPSDVISPIDVMPQIPNEVFWKLPILGHSAAPCKPGKVYMVTCNTCLCMDNGNLLCEKLLCIDQEEMNESKAKKWSGTRCKKGDTSLSTRCVRCQCVNDVTNCNPIPGCVEPKILKLHGDSKVRMSLDTKTEKCEPGTVYRTDCNFCYCQANQMLRCTRKSCLNYRQSLMLKQQRSYLEKHGL